jgi:uncharacterized membrane protein
MEPGLGQLLAATATFVGAHFALSSAGLRRPIVAHLGDGPFRGLYSVAALATFIWMIWAYGAAPYVELWPAAPWAHYLPLLVMPVSAILIVAGASTRSVTAMGGESMADAHDPTPGIVRVTRHPVMWGIALWALSHLPPNGDAASLILNGGILALALGGMAHIDARRRAALGSAWGPIELTTSAVPFVAIAAGRTTMDWAGIGWPRLAGGLALYVVLLLVHEWVVGVSALPA